MAQTLCHVTEMGIFIIYLAKIGMGAKIFIGGKWGAKLDGMGIGHISLNTLKR